MQLVKKRKGINEKNKLKKIIENESINKINRRK